MTFKEDKQKMDGDIGGEGCAYSMTMTFHILKVPIELGGHAKDGRRT